MGRKGTYTVGLGSMLIIIVVLCVIIMRESGQAIESKVTTLPITAEEDKGQGAEIGALIEENTSLERQIAEYKRKLSWTKADYKYLLEDMNESNNEFVTELNAYYQVMDEEQRKLVDTYIPSRTKYNIYELEIGDKHKNFTVDQLQVYKNEQEKIVEYSVHYTGKETITGQLYYDYGFQEEVWLKIDKYNLSKLPHHYSYEYIQILNSDDIRKDMEGRHMEGIEVTIIVDGYEGVQEDYTCGIMGIHYVALVEQY